MIDLVNSLTASRLLAPANVKTTTASASFDLSGYQAGMFLVDVSSYGDTLSSANSFEFDVQFSGDNSTFNAVSDQYVQYAVGVANGAANTGAGALLASGASGSGAAVIKIGFLGNARYVRLNIVVKGTMTVGTVLGVYFVAGHPLHLPAGSPQIP